MKKIFSFLLLLVFSFVYNCPVFAFNISTDKNDASTLLGIKSSEKGTFYIKTQIPKNYKIKKENNKWGVINKDDNSILVPYEYQKIVPLGIDTLKVKKDNKWGVITNNNKSVLQPEFDKVYLLGINPKMPKDIVHSLYFGKKGKNIFVATPGRNSTDFFTKTFNKNNESSWLKFYDYPKEGILVLKQGKKYGFLTLKGDKNWIIKPQYDDFYIQDKGTTIFQHFSVSYSNPEYIIVKKGKKWGIINADGTTSVDFQYDSVIMLDSTIKENVDIHDNIVDFKYVNITFPEEDKIIAKKEGKTYIINKKGYIFTEKPTVENNLKYNYNNTCTNFLNKLYEENNKTAFVKFYNYPSKGIYLTKENGKFGLKIISDTIKTIPAEYEDFSFQDSNTGIYKQLGVSFSNPERILAKRNGKWGIINSSNNVIVDFQYDKTMILSAIPYSNASIDNNGVNIKYKNIEYPQSNLMIVKKGDLYGVIDTNGKYIIPLKYKSLQKPIFNKHLNQYNAKNNYEVIAAAAKIDNKETTLSQKTGAIIPMIIMAPVGIAALIVFSPILVFLLYSFKDVC